MTEFSNSSDPLSPLDRWKTDIRKGKKQLAVLIDPDKCGEDVLPKLLSHLPDATTHIFVGGSSVAPGVTHDLIVAIKRLVNLPIWIFPGDAEQISPAADALLFLSLVSGDNPEYLIRQQERAAAQLQAIDLFTIATGYLLIDGGRDSAVAKVTKTLPLSLNDPDKIANRAMAALYMGAKSIYLEAGSGAKNPIPATVITRIKKQTELPLIVGGGLRETQQIESAWAAGADMVVIGTAIEEIITNNKIQN
ncbi:MAG: geranylgeranylglyceryl/heptaprenylglyceryl phosphate synthase [Flavobacteriaceae bacterium]|nr:geranylgeranylglyceryl/heptaprenylglyceryl phosphate synthase [Flavobacteriaceae bacterium]NBT86718.1 geranylgeranylglyceryl/heptaprenylglyceryl phosphate synthase [Flavobacteriaceae bacterium]